jgi:small subunit ribosomal protein S8
MASQLFSVFRRELYCEAREGLANPQCNNQQSIRRKLKMTMSDPIADMLTRIRNANTAKHDTVDVPASKMKLAIANILLEEGYIKKYEIVEDGGFQTIRISLKYNNNKSERIISGSKKISKPGLRIYAGKEDMPKVLGGLGIAIVSTNQGVITDKKARELGVGGEVLAFVW